MVALKNMDVIDMEKKEKVHKYENEIKLLKKQTEHYEDNDWIDFSTNRCAVEDFAHDAPDVDLMTEEIDIYAFTITKRCAIDILRNDERVQTTNWSGTVISRTHYNAEDEKKISEPAYGGYGNTDGVSESGQLFINRELLLKFLPFKSK